MAKRVRGDAAPYRFWTLVAERLIFNHYRTPLAHGFEKRLQHGGLNAPFRHGHDADFRKRGKPRVVPGDYVFGDCSHLSEITRSVRLHQTRSERAGRYKP